MTAAVLDGPAAAAYLRLLQDTPAPARELVDRLFALPKVDQILVLLELAQRAGGSFRQALNHLPCLDGCDHDRHAGESCTAAFVGDNGEQLCPCRPDEREPAVAAAEDVDADRAKRERWIERAS